MSDRWEWVEIIEPRTKEHMYANLTTGECVWDPPPGVKIKKTDNNQWWELFDQNTSRFYYYNATSQKTVWHRPQNCDIIPLAKLQTLKQNTEVRDFDDDTSPVKREISTQTPVGTPHHVRTGSVRSNSVHTSPHAAQRRHRHHHHTHHHHHRGAKEGGQSEGGPPDSIVNGDQQQPKTGGSSRRRDGQSRPNANYIRRDFPEPPAQSTDSPRPQRSLDLQKSLELQRSLDLHRGSLDQVGSPVSHAHSQSQSHLNHPLYVRQESFPRDEYSGYAREMSSQYPDVSQIVAVQVTPRPKPRAFPRTNPAYVGVSRRDGVPSYKRINIEQHQPPTAIYNQRFYNAHSQHAIDPLHAGLHDTLIQTAPDDRQLGFRHDRSDSDTSHSSYGINRLQQSEMTDSQISHCSLVTSKHQKEQHSDSQSSQGSLRGLPDNHSSQGSLRDHELDFVSSSQNSPRHGSVNEPITTSELSQSQSRHQRHHHHHPQQQQQQQQQPQPQAPYRNKNAKSRSSPQNSSGGSQRSLTRRNSEPDYANLPIIAHIRGGRIMTVDDPITRQEQEKMTTSMNSEDQGAYDLKSGDSLRSGDSLSPADFCTRHDTPTSVRSHSTQNSSHSHMSEGYPDQGFEDSDNSSVFSTPSPKSRGQHHQQHPHHGVPSPPHLSLETHHASLKRKKIPEKTDTLLRQQTLEKSQSLQVELAHQRPLSMVLASQSEANVILNPATASLQRQMDIEQFAMENLNEHKKGLLGKAVPIGNMLTWTKDIIQKPMIRTNDKMVKKEAPEVFKLVQMYMGDRKAKCSLPGLALDVMTKGWSLPSLRDEVYIQLCRQTTDNRKDDSLQRGWELMGICLAFFPPSLKFQSYLEGYIYRHLDPSVDSEKVPVSHFAAHCQRRLERALKTGAKKGLRKPTMDEIEMAKKSIFHPSMFGNRLQDIMQMQKEKYPDRKLPWIQTVLSEEMLQLDGAQTEGIFRVPGDIDEVNALKVKCDQWHLPTGCPDPHIPASLLKLWYRELYEPLIPSEFYEQCVNNYANAEAAINIVNSLPHINRLVLCYLIRFLQVFIASENVTVTKMDVNNLAMVFAPNCLRCESDDPRIIFENTRKEMGFMRTLIQNLETSFMEGIL